MEKHRETSTGLPVAVYVDGTEYRLVYERADVALYRAADGRELEVR